MTDRSRPRAPRNARRHPLEGLDAALLELRSLVTRPGYRRRLLGPLGRRIELSTARLLQTIERAAVPPSIGEVAQALAIDPSTASRLVDQRVGEGLLERRRSPEDGRRTTLHLTDGGRALLAELADSRRTILAEMTASWDVVDVEALETLMGRLAESFARLESERGGSTDAPEDGEPRRAA
jgi:DNA-binding MarR family transcriptional regulator